MANKRLINYILTVVSVLYLGACAYLYYNQRSLIYFPDTNLEEPAKYDLPEATAIKLKTSDNLQITAWYIPPKKDKPILVYFQGNGKNLGKRADKFREFSNVGFGILAVSYRGFGDSEGSPTEEGLYNDARAAIKYLTSKEMETKDIVLFGESLGTCVAIQMALEHDFRAIILEAPYDSIGARAAELYPIFPVRLLLKDKFLSINKIANIHTPLLVFHSKDDMVMPIHHGIKLFIAAPEPKKLFVFENAGHNKFDYHTLATLMLDFIKAENHN